MIYLTDDGVRPGNNIGLMLGLMICNQVLEMFDCSCGLTSLNDKHHSQTSLHYSDNAFDIRIYDFPEDVNAVVVTNEMKRRLGKHYDVVLEKDHIHVEFQPRGY